MIGTRDIIKLLEVHEVEVDEDYHINLSSSITKDTENPANIFKADDIHDEKKDIIRKENVIEGNTVADHSKTDTGKSVIDHENDELNSSFFEAINHEKEKKKVVC